MSELKTRLDVSLLQRELVRSRSQAESYIKLSKVKVNGRIVTKAGTPVSSLDSIELLVADQYVSRAALKLASVVGPLQLHFNDKVVLDVGSSTGGFTDYALQHGAKKVIAVEIGKGQLHPSLRGNSQIELYEQTDIRMFQNNGGDVIDIVVADISFMSLREALPHIAVIAPRAQIVAMVKPQFEAIQDNLKHKGVIKNERLRRDILTSFEVWAKRGFVIRQKMDSAVAGAHGNRERFYLLQPLQPRTS